MVEWTYGPFEPVERDVEPIPKGVRSKIGGEKEEA